MQVWLKPIPFVQKILRRIPTSSIKTFNRMKMNLLNINLCKLSSLLKTNYLGFETVFLNVIVNLQYNPRYWSPHFTAMQRSAHLLCYKQSTESLYFPNPSFYSHRLCLHSLVCNTRNRFSGIHLNAVIYNPVTSENIYAYRKLSF